MFPKMALPHLTVAMLLVVICSSPNSTAILGKRTFEVMTSRPREPNALSTRTVYLEATNGDTRAIRFDVARRYELLRGMIDLSDPEEDNIIIRVPVDAALMESLIELLSSDRIPSHVNHKVLLQMAPAILFVNGDHVLDRVCMALEGQIAIPNGQYSASIVAQLLADYAITLGVCDLPDNFIEKCTSRIAVMYFRRSCPPILDGKTLFCREKGIWGFLQKDWFSNLTCANVEHVYNANPDVGVNNIGAIVGERVFDRFRSLRAVDLSHNRISAITDGAFAGLSSLHTLDLASNQISTVSRGALTGLPSLKDLSLAVNEIVTIEALALDELSSLEFLDLEGNQISTVEIGAFATLATLRILRLTDNSISMISTGAFAGLLSLEVLYLEDNLMSSFRMGVFAGLPFLRYLDLGGNQITTIAMGVFGRLPAMQTLDLECNRITRITRGAFAGMPALAVLQLAHNLMTTIATGDFIGLPSLKTLLLGHNDISAIETDAFKGLLSLRVLNWNDSYRVPSGLRNDALVVC